MHQHSPLLASDFTETGTVLLPVSALPYGIAVLDRFMRIQDINHHLMSALNLSGEPPVGKPLTDVLPDTEPIVSEYMNKKLAASPVEIVVQHPVRNKSIALMLHQVVLPDTPPSGFLITIKRDHTVDIPGEMPRDEQAAARLDIIEQERRKISRDLHDGLGQLLMAAHLNLELAQSQLGTASKHPADAQLKKVRKNLMQALDEVRIIAGNLRPSMLDDFGLKPALQKLCDNTRNSKLNVSMTATDLKKRLPVSLETSVYRICQEALNNIARHSGATQSRIDLYQRRSKLVIHIQDNGCGIKKNQEPETGCGLTNIKERVELLKGTLHIESTEMSGTELIIEIPLPSETQSGKTA